MQCKQCSMAVVVLVRANSTCPIPQERGCSCPIHPTRTRSAFGSGFATQGGSPRASGHMLIWQCVQVLLQARTAPDHGRGCRRQQGSVHRPLGMRAQQQRCCWTCGAAQRGRKPCYQLPCKLTPANKGPLDTVGPPPEGACTTPGRADSVRPAPGRPRMCIALAGASPEQLA